ncbi:MAG TPA: gamma-glutamyltransferase family protein [Gaiellaceae bacterium]|nr:gamma-glutamyltransferase family protein [Gaiellaceae bacterium]
MSFTTRPELRGTFGMVASTHWLASAAGMAVLERGGNAFDAAVAAGFTLQVVEPNLNGPGGDLPALLWPAGGEPVVLCAQGPAPHLATIDAYRSLGLDLIPGTGPLAAVVPGAFGGWISMLRDHGTMDLADVLQYAIHYAENGYPVLPAIVRAIRNVEQLFRADWTTSADLYLPLPEVGTLHRNPQLAATYRRILDADDPLDAWYRGFVAEAMLAFQEREWLDSSGERHAGLLREDDLRDWRPVYEQPLAVDYHGYTVLKAGPWSQAPVFLQQLRLLEGFDLAAMGLASAEYVHTVTECAKLAFADREAWYGDPAFADVPMDELLSRAYADDRRALVGDTAASELRPGSPGGREPRLPAPVGSAPVAPGVGEPTRAGLEASAAEPPTPGRVPGAAGGVARGDTVHLDVVDRWGNMVAATPSGGWFWGAPVIPELGFPLGTRAQMFWLEDDLPNSLAPGKRPRTTLSPTLVGRDGEPYLALGTPGGDQQDQWTLNTFLAHVHFGLDLQAAIDAPGHHTEAFPSSFYPRETLERHVAVETRAGEETVQGLEARGHDVEVADAWALGRVSAVGKEPDGQLKAGANPRGMQGYAVGR